MFGILEDGERLPSKEEKAKFIKRLFDITSLAPIILITYEPISVEDFKLCIEITEKIKNNAKEKIDKELKEVE